MSLDEQMHREVERLEREISDIDDGIQKLNTKITNLINIKKKKEHDLRVLKENFAQQNEEETQTTLMGMIIDASPRKAIEAK